ncbi:MAG: hypothetical protein KKD44_03080 [Proteobacteria bacterium]|nr:hypothetical protein [Pseudomonadota bacterium]
MKKEIVMLDGSQIKENDVCKLLAGHPYHIKHVKTLAACENYIQHHRCSALILDLDTVAIDNRTIGRLKKKHPGINIIAKSQRTFHPEFEESLRHYFFACLAKPLDSDELNYWLKLLP